MNKTSFSGEYMRNDQPCKYDSYYNISLPADYKHYKDNALSIDTNLGLAIFLLVMSPFGILGNVYILADLNEWHCFKSSKMMNKIRYFKKNVKFYLKGICYGCLFLCLLFLFWPYYYLLPGCARENGTFAFMFWLGKLEWILEEVVICFVNYLISIMCTDTYIAMKHPFFYRNKCAYTDRTIRIIVLTLAFFSILLVLPFALYFDILSRPPPNPPILLDQNHTFKLNHSTMPVWAWDAKRSYFIRFNKDILSFSRIYDPVEVILVHVIPCVFIFVLNGLTIHSFIIRERKSLAKIGSGIGIVVQSSEITNVSENITTPFTIMSGSPEKNTKQHLEVRATGNTQGNLMSAYVTDRIQQIKDRNMNVIILTSLLSVITVLFSIPWIVFIFIKSSRCEKGLKLCNLFFQTVAHDLVFTKFYIFPYLILLGDRRLKDAWRILFLKHIYKPIKSIWKNIYNKFSPPYMINNKVNVH
ncbi:unnamed protein product [Gordionus sp. m RMFG-2023]